MILDKAKSVGLTPEKMMRRVLVFSDMQFNEASRGTFNASVHETSEKEYAEAGYPVPQIVYWNLRVSRGGLPVTKDSSNALLMSGQMLKHIMGGRSLDMIQLMMDSINGPLFDNLKVLD
jgi:hypothetical protein